MVEPGGQIDQWLSGLHPGLWSSPLPNGDPTLEVAIMGLPLLERRRYFTFAAFVHEDDFSDDVPIDVTLVIIVGYLTSTTLLYRET